MTIQTETLLCNVFQPPIAAGGPSLSKCRGLQPIGTYSQPKAVNVSQPGSENVEGLEPQLAAHAYRHSLMQIQVPVRVTLASKKVSISEVIDLGPGSIFKFERTCEEPLELCVGDQTVAKGDVVKVGDKFGLTITEILPPKERFIPIRRLINRQG